MGFSSHRVKARGVPSLSQAHMEKQLFKPTDNSEFPISLTCGFAAGHSDITTLQFSHHCLQVIFIYFFGSGDTDQLISALSVAILIQADMKSFSFINL